MAIERGIKKFFKWRNFYRPDRGEVWTRGTKRNSFIFIEASDKQVRPKKTTLESLFSFSEEMESNYYPAKFSFTVLSIRLQDFFFGPRPPFFSSYLSRSEFIQWCCKSSPSSFHILLIFLFPPRIRDSLTLFLCLPVLKLHRWNFSLAC